MRNDRSSNSPQKGADNTDRIIINPLILLRIIWSRWYWLLISVIVCLSVGYLYAKSVQRKFSSEALLKYDKKTNESKFSPTKMLGGDDGSSEYMAEVYSVKSSSVVEKALDSLKADFYFTAKEGLRGANIYPMKPFTYDVLDYNVDLFSGGEFTLIRKDKAYDISFENEEMDKPIVFSSIKPGTIIKVPGLAFSITSNVTTDKKKIKFTYIDYWAKRSISDRIVMKEAERNMPVIKASFSSDSRPFTKDFLRTLINTYRNYDVDVKRKSSDRTLSFINEQLNAFESLMRKSSSKLQNIKQEYDLLDVGATSSQYMQSISDLRTRKLNLEIQEKNFDLVTDDIKNNKEVVANVVGWDGTTDPFLNKMLQDLNEYIGRRKQNLINFSEESVVIRNIDDVIATLKYKIIENIKLQRKKSEQAYSAYNKQIADLSRDLGRMPSAERDLIYTTSDVEVNKNIYTLLLNKKLETSIDKAGQTASFSVIEESMVATQTAPFEKLILLISAFLGLIVGVISILLKRIFNNKFTNIGALAKDRHISLLGVIDHHNNAKEFGEQNLVSGYADNGPFVESINNIRTNLLFLAKKAKGNIVAITSEMSGEGKSFVALNLAAALAKVDKSVIIVASDLRRSRLHKQFNVSNDSGLSTYLEGNAQGLGSVVRKSKVNQLDFINAGPVPRNPSELILKDRFWKLLDQLKNEYDFIIIDTAPVGMVSDSMPILRFSDINIFVVRWLYSGKDSDELPAKFAEENQLSNVKVVVNDFRRDNLYENMDGKDGSYNKYFSNYGKYNSDDDIRRKPLWKRIASYNR